VLGTALGVALAQVLSRALIAFLSTENNPVFVGLAPDLRMLGFTAAMAVGTPLFGLLPALRATRIAPAAAMRAGGRDHHPDANATDWRAALHRSGGVSPFCR
jgi:ABC-type lipoprotein release transport system permease subunit